MESRQTTLSLVLGILSSLIMAAQSSRLACATMRESAMHDTLGIAEAPNLDCPQPGGFLWVGDVAAEA